MQMGTAIAMAVPTAVPATTSTTMQIMTVECPPGMGAGMPLRVDTPSGLMSITIPPGVREGMPFQFHLPPVATPLPVATAVQYCAPEAYTRPVPAVPSPPPPAPTKTAQPQPVGAEYLSHEYVCAHRVAAPTTQAMYVTGTCEPPERDWTVGAWKTFAGGPDEWKAGSGLECYRDVPHCALGCVCPCILLCQNARMLRMGPAGSHYPDASMFECPGQCLAWCTNITPYCIGYCVGMCVCPEHTNLGCYVTSLIKMTMHKYNLRFPLPCGDAECIGPVCLCSAFWCSPCMLCLVHRELTLREGQDADVV
ncbi:hypothetical protein AB1Y20_005637 [Prymnesium parvum]|uniref:Uncharacterized protein n=1 Tax=Prymnesium parvum TaxID=97485 RepID=A0AB34J4Q3_PRYPA